MKSVKLIPTNQLLGERFNSADELPENLIVNGNGQICEVVPLSSGSFDARLNATGDIPNASMGYQIVIDTLTYLSRRVVKQKFYDVPGGIATYVPLRVGEGAWHDNILTGVSVSSAGDFESGNIRTAQTNSRLAGADAAIAPITQKIVTWAKEITFTYPEVQQALLLNNWDVIEAKHYARKKNWDLGIQEIAFLGSRLDANVQGLLTQTGVNVNTSFITAPVSGLNAANFATFVSGLINLYFVNTNSTQMPNRLIMPMSDYLGLQVLTPGSAGTFPVPMIQYLEMAFKKATQLEDFRIIGLPYANAAVNNSLRGINKNIYALYRSDDDSLAMNIPVDYMTTQVGTLNNFQFQDVGAGQYTGVQVYRPLEVLYFTYTP